MPYAPHSHAAGTKGYAQCLDRLQFMLENWHSQICSHPSLRHRDDYFDDHRELVANISHDMFVLLTLFNTYEMEQDRHNQSVQ